MKSILFSFKDFATSPETQSFLLKMVHSFFKDLDFAIIPASGLLQ